MPCSCRKTVFRTYFDYNDIFIGLLMPQNLTPIPELYVSPDSAQKLKQEAGELISHDLTSRQICDLELLMNGGFYPL